MKTTAHHQLTDAQPVPEQQAALLPWAGHDVIWIGIFFWSLRISCPGCVPSLLLVHPQPACWWDGVRSRSFNCLSAAQQQLKHLPVIGTVSNTNPNHNPILVSIKNINPTPAKTSTPREADTWYLLPPSPLGLKGEAGHEVLPQWVKTNPFCFPKHPSRWVQQQAWLPKMAASPPLLPLLRCPHLPLVPGPWKLKAEAA